MDWVKPNTYKLPRYVYTVSARSYMSVPLSCAHGTSLSGLAQCVFDTEFAFGVFQVRRRGPCRRSRLLRLAAGSDWHPAHWRHHHPPPATATSSPASTTPGHIQVRRPNIHRSDYWSYTGQTRGHIQVRLPVIHRSDAQYTHIRLPVIHRSDSRSYIGQTPGHM